MFEHGLVRMLDGRPSKPSSILKTYKTIHLGDLYTITVMYMFYLCALLITSFERKGVSVLRREDQTISKALYRKTGILLGILSTKHIIMNLELGKLTLNSVTAI